LPFPALFQELTLPEGVMPVLAALTGDIKLAPLSESTSQASERVLSLLHPMFESNTFILEGSIFLEEE
jgi:hypothetical protein